MSKELTPLEALEKLGKLNVEEGLRIKLSKTIVSDYIYYKIIETALKRLETLEEEKQSFDRQLEKKLKALEIIKEKNINVRGIINSPTIEYYIDHCMPRHSGEPTQEEYDLLKEALL